ncbi:MAG TPA: hypothetical protein VLX56_08190 [Nitrososphaerales archaeon]|nr:hypothetical protein [Nitrososphaerales archaeon]
MAPPSILVVQNAQWEGPGLIEECASVVGLDLAIARMFHRQGSIPLERLEKGGFVAVVGLGSPSTAYLPETNPNHHDLVELFKQTRRRKIPSFNVCYSMQLFSIVHGGKVAKNPAGKEVGLYEVTPSREAESEPVLGGMGPFVTLQWHGDIVERLPPGSVHLASSEKTENQVAVLDGIHYLFQGDGQAATPRMVRTWLRRDGKWAREGTGLDGSRLLADVGAHEAYLRNTYIRIFSNFLGLVLSYS